MTTQRSPSILVITDRRDAHIQYVQKHLATPLLIIDPLELLDETGLTFTFSKAGTEVTYKGNQLSDVQSIWYRKPSEIRPEVIPVGAAYKQYSQTAMTRHFYLLYNAFPSAYWLSDYYDIVRASDKAWQLTVAKQLGLPVLDTVITSDKHVAKKFILGYSRTVVKPLTVTHATLGEKNGTFFTTLLEDGFMPDLGNLHLAPAIFQKAVDMVHDVRVTVVGDKVFAATVRAEGLSKSRVYDYRLGHSEGRVIIEALNDFPQELSDLCVKHTQALGLEFGALDFGQDKKGNFWFFENNPNGQWAFIEKATGQPIGKAIAERLARPPSTRRNNLASLGEKK